MKLFKSLVIFAFCIALISVNVAAKSEYIKVNVGDNSVGIDVPSEYSYITYEDVEKPAAYFKNLPLDKNEAITRINDNGVVFDAFSNTNDVEVKCTVTTDNFSKSIANFSPMDENDKNSVMNTFKSGIEQAGHAFLTEPKVTEIDGYDFIDYSCRISSGDKGYFYRSVMTIIGGKCYEFTFYSTMVAPDEETKTLFSDMISSIQLNIEGESGQIAGSIFKSVIAIIVIVIAGFMFLWLGYSLVKQLIYYRNRNEKVKLKKR